MDIDAVQLQLGLKRNLLHWYERTSDIPNIASRIDEDLGCQGFAANGQPGAKRTSHFFPQRQCAFPAVLFLTLIRVSPALLDNAVSPVERPLG